MPKDNPGRSHPHTHTMEINKMIDSQKVYRTLEEAIDETERQLRLGGFKGQFGLIMFSGKGFSREHKLYFELSNQTSYSSSEKVQGTDLQDVVDEFLRRQDFTRQQKIRCLGAPEIEVAAEALPEVPPADARNGHSGELDDEIPF